MGKQKPSLIKRIISRMFGLAFYLLLAGALAAFANTYFNIIPINKFPDLAITIGAWATAVIAIAAVIVGGYIVLFTDMMDTDVTGQKTETQ